MPGHYTPRYGAAYWGMLRQEPPDNVSSQGYDSPPRSSHQPRSTASTSPYNIPSRSSHRSSRSPCRPRSQPPPGAPPRGPTTSPNVYEMLSSNESSRGRTPRARDLPGYASGSRSPSAANDAPEGASRGRGDRLSRSGRESTSRPLPSPRRSSRVPASPSRLGLIRSSRLPGGSAHGSDASRYSLPSSMHAQVSEDWTFERPHAPAREPVRRRRSPPRRTDEQPRFRPSQAHRRGDEGRNELREAVRDFDRSDRRERRAQPRNELRDAVRRFDRSDRQ